MLNHFRSSSWLSVFENVHLKPLLKPIPPVNYQQSQGNRDDPDQPNVRRHAKRPVVVTTKVEERRTEDTLKRGQGQVVPNTHLHAVRTATAVQGRKARVIAAIVFMELLSAFMILESAWVTRLKDWKSRSVTACFF